MAGSFVRAARGRSGPARRSSRSTRPRSRTSRTHRSCSRANFLGVVAPQEFDAIQAAAQLKVTWQDKPHPAQPGNLFKKMRAQVTRGAGGHEQQRPGGRRQHRRRTRVGGENRVGHLPVPNGSRVAIGPAVRLPMSRRARRSSTAAHSRSRASSPVSRNSSGCPHQVRVYYYEGSSSFGSAQSTSDTPKAAAMLSQLAGAPVRLQLMRWDENGWDNYQSAQLSDLQGGVDANGKLDRVPVHADLGTVLDGDRPDLRADRVDRRSRAPAMSGARCDEPSCGVKYYSPNKVVSGLTLPVYNGYFRAGSHRSGGEGQLASFATEQFMDELAYAAGMDPIAFRVLNASNIRWAGVVSAADAAGWQPRVANSVKQSGTIVTGRGVGSGIHGTAGMSAAVRRDLGEQEDRQDHRLEHLQRDRCRPGGQSGRGREPDLGRLDHGPEPDPARRGELQQDERHEPRLGRATRSCASGRRRR